MSSQPEFLVLTTILAVLTGLFTALGLPIAGIVTGALALLTLAGHLLFDVHARRRSWPRWPQRGSRI